MNRSTLVIAMVSSNLGDLMGGTRPGSSQHLREAQNIEPDPRDSGSVESHLVGSSDPPTSVSDFHQVTNATP